MARSIHFELDMATPAGVAFDFVRRNCSLFPIIVREENSQQIRRQIQEVKLLQGAWDSVGSKRQWTFGGNYAHWENWTDTVEHQAIDDKMSIIFTLLEGRVLGGYKSLKLAYYFSPGNSGCKAKGVVTFEKQLSNVADPYELLGFLRKMVEAVEAFFQGTG